MNKSITPVRAGQRFCGSHSLPKSAIPTSKAVYGGNVFGVILNTSQGVIGTSGPLLQALSFHLDDHGQDFAEGLVLRVEGLPVGLIDAGFERGDEIDRNDGRAAGARRKERKFAA